MNNEIHTKNAISLCLEKYYLIFLINIHYIFNFLEKFTKINF